MDGVCGRVGENLGGGGDGGRGVGLGGLERAYVPRKPLPPQTTIFLVDIVGVGAGYRFVERVMIMDIVVVGDDLELLSMKELLVVEIVIREDLQQGLFRYQISTIKISPSLPIYIRWPFIGSLHWAFYHILPTYRKLICRSVKSRNPPLLAHPPKRSREGNTSLYSFTQKHSKHARPGRHQASEGTCDTNALPSTP